jgi:hypothetical protein
VTTASRPLRPAPEDDVPLHLDRGLVPRAPLAPFGPRCRWSVPSELFQAASGKRHMAFGGSRLRGRARRRATRLHYPAGGAGEVSHAVPFQRMTSGRSVPAYSPTATQTVREAQVMAFKYASSTRPGPTSQLDFVWTTSSVQLAHVPGWSQ